jgi:hypothetical protein
METIINILSVFFMLLKIMFFLMLTINNIADIIFNTNPMGTHTHKPHIDAKGTSMVNKDKEII